MATLQELREMQKPEIPMGMDGLARQGKQGILQVLETVSAQSLKLPQTESMPSAERSADKPVCPLCEGMGQLRMDVPIGHPQFGKLVRCPCRAAADSAYLQEISSMTPEEKNWRLDDIDCEGETKKDTRVMVDACQTFLVRPYGMLTIYGTCGNSKSHALCALVNQTLEQGHEAVYVLAFDLINYIRKAYSEKNSTVVDDDAYSRLMRFSGVNLLCIDELDKIFPLTYWEGKQLSHFFNERYRHGTAEEYGTVVAMNGNPFDVLDGLWHILSRMKDGRNRIIQNFDEDMRPGMRGGCCGKHGLEVCAECDWGMVWSGAS